ncbi:MAG TPA: hypothetical protein VEZ40_13070 [Pyrinomonadaceae bacterium]|nr:hypothetical protein [Pyrinomonadaceae bacterium]
MAAFLALILTSMSTLMTMKEELTITQATERLQARGIDVARRTVASWIEQGLFTRRLVETPTGNYWVIPAHEVDSFEKPKVGRPPKAKADTNSKASKKKRQ